MKVRWQHIEVLRLEPSTRTARWSTHSLTQQASETVCEKYEGPSRVTWECCVPVSVNVIVTQNLELIPCKFLNSGGISCPRWPHSGLNSGAGCVYRRWQQGLLLATYAAAALATASMVRPPSDASSAAAAHAMWQARQSGIRCCRESDNGIDSAAMQRRPSPRQPPMPIKWRCRGRSTSTLQTIGEGTTIQRRRFFFSRGCMCCSAVPLQVRQYRTRCHRESNDVSPPTNAHPWHQIDSRRCYICCCRVGDGEHGTNIG